jgi:hypothetical protein
MMKQHVGRGAMGRAAAPLALLLAAGMAVPAALAQHRQHPGQGPGHGYPQHRGQQWHGDIARFHQHDWGVWRGGHWAHAHHGGRLGWWWVVGPSWYYYPAPVYPYPSPWEPAEVIVSGPPPARFWYYCDATRNYYPYVSVCPGGWRPVPATPPAANVPPPNPGIP